MTLLDNNFVCIVAAIFFAIIGIYMIINTINFYKLTDDTAREVISKAGAWTMFSLNLVGVVVCILGVAYFVFLIIKNIPEKAAIDTHAATVTASAPLLPAAPLPSILPLSPNPLDLSTPLTAPMVQSASTEPTHQIVQTTSGPVVAPLSSRIASFFKNTFSRNKPTVTVVQTSSGPMTVPVTTTSAGVPVAVVPTSTGSVAVPVAAVPLTTTVPAASGKLSKPLKNTDVRILYNGSLTNATPDIETKTIDLVNTVRRSLK